MKTELELFLAKSVKEATEYLSRSQTGSDLLQLMDQLKPVINQGLDIFNQVLTSRASELLARSFVMLSSVLYFLSKALALWILYKDGGKLNEIPLSDMDNANIVWLVNSVWQLVVLAINQIDNIQEFMHAHHLPEVIVWVVVILWMTTNVVWFTAAATKQEKKVLLGLNAIRKNFAHNGKNLVRKSMVGMAQIAEHQGRDHYWQV